MVVPPFPHLESGINTELPSGLGASWCMGSFQSLAPSLLSPHGPHRQRWVGGGHLTPTDDVELLHLLGCGGNKMNNEAQPGRKEASDRLMPPPTQEACHISHRKWGPSHRQTGWPTLLGAPTQVSTC